MKCEEFTGMAGNSRKLKVTRGGTQGSHQGSSKLGFYSGNHASLPRLLKQALTLGFVPGRKGQWQEVLGMDLN